MPPASDSITAHTSRATNELALRLSNTAAPLRELVRRDTTILLENALVDTARPAGLPIPEHLRAAGDPGSYVVQARGPIDAGFRSLLQGAGATVVSYIPNNAYLVRASGAVAQQVQADPRTQAVLAYEPYYKLKPSLLKLAVRQEPLPEGSRLNLLLFADARDQTLGELAGLGVQVLGESPSPFGPVVGVLPPVASLALVAGLAGVQEVELAAGRVLANDLSRVQIGVSSDTLGASNYLGLTGAKVLVNVNDSGVDGTQPDLAPRVVASDPGALVDANGHGTHVAGIIASSGASSSSPVNVGAAASGSLSNASFRGKAPAAGIFVQPVAMMTKPMTDGGTLSWPSDAVLQQGAARTNAFISNNGWNYVGTDSQTYDLHAASYDAAVRDALPAVTGSQPVLFVFSAGNAGGGDNSGGSGQSGTIESPATAKNVITVGAIEQLRTITNAVSICSVVNGTNSCATNQPWLSLTDSTNQVAAFSSRGNVGVNVEGDFGRFKPDVVAPGTFVVLTRSGQWDTNAYYDPTSHIDTPFPDIVVASNDWYQDSIFVPDNAVQLNLTVVPNNSSPVPFPDLAILVSRSHYPTNAADADFVGTNAVSLPPDFPLSPVGATWYYAVGDSTTQVVTFDLATDIVVTNELGDYLQVLAGMNDALGPYYRYESGTSMAAADASGMLALMQEFFESRLGRTNHSPALLKALLINGARTVSGNYDFNVRGAVNYQGWGLIHLPTSLPGSLSNQTAATRSIFALDQDATNALATGQSHTRYLTLSPAAQSQPLRVTLVWTDPPGNPVASVKLVNDLDLIVTNLDTAEVFFGNDILAGSDFNLPLDTNAVPNVDTVNNVENVYLSPALTLNGRLGTNYAITVVGRRVNVNAVTASPDNVAQDYALVISSGDGESANALTLSDAPIVYRTQPLVTVISNSFGSSPGYMGGFLLNQRVGANPPLMGTNSVLLPTEANGVLTLGLTNQWHFYVITNNTRYTNAAFLTFLPPNLAVPRMGVFESSADLATRPEADIDLYVAPPSLANNYGLTNLDPVVIEGTDKSLSRGGTETVVYSNATGGVYYLGIQSEDQQAAEYALLAVFSEQPFGGTDTNGNQHLIGFPTPMPIPDGSPAQPGVALVMAIAAQPIKLHRVVVTNVINHELMTDLIGSLSHAGQFAILNNHTCVSDPVTTACETWTSYLYDDSDERNVLPSPFLLNPIVQHTDGPGTLSNFANKDGIGQWQLTMVDNATNHIGTNISLGIFLELQQNLASSVGITAVILGGACREDYVDVPADAVSLTVDLGVVTASPPIQLTLQVCPASGGTCKSLFITNTLGGSVTIDQTDLPPLQSGGSYIVRTCNLNTTPVTVNLRARFNLSFNTITPVVRAQSTVPVSLADDAVTDIYLTNNLHQIISSLDVGLLINDPRVSDLAITLISPNGTRVLLFENRGGLTTNGLGLGTFGLAVVTNLAPVYTNDFDLAPVGWYAPGARFQGWGVLSNLVEVLDDNTCLCQSNHVLGLMDGGVFNSLPTTNGLLFPNPSPYTLSYRVNHLPWLEGMVSWWPLDGDGADIFGGLNGQLLGDVTFGQGEVDQAFFGDGVATRMMVPACPELDLGQGRGLSLEGWINPRNVGNPAPLAEWYDPDPPTNQSPLGVQFWLALTNGPGSLGAVIWDSHSQGHVVTTAPGMLTNGGWQHVALTYDTSSGVAALYVNGLTNHQPLVSTNLGLFVPRTTGDLYFGFHPPSLPPGACYAGGLDEMSVYERALTPCEVNAIFHAGSGGKYGTNVLVCPVATAVTLLTSSGVQTYAFTNGLTWTNSGPQWETNTISFSTATNPTALVVSGLNPYNPADPNAPNNLNALVDDFVLSALVTNTIDGLLHFTEDTNLAVLPIKFAPAPYVASNFPVTLVFSNDFNRALAGLYRVGSSIPGGPNSPGIGTRDWTVTQGSVTVLSNAFFDTAAANALALATGSVQCLLPTIPGHRYQLSYSLRGPCAVGWWNGSVDPLSQRAQDLISGNNGAFFNGAASVTPGFVGPQGLAFTADPASKIELGDPPQLQFTNAFTIEGWIQPLVASNLTGCGTAQLFFRGYPAPLDCGGLGDPYWLALEPGTNAGGFDLHFHIAEAPVGTVGADVRTLNAPLPVGGGTTGAWWHVAAVFDKPFTNVTVLSGGTNLVTVTSNALRLYLNGVCVASNFTTLSPYRDLDPAWSPGVTLGNRSRSDYTQPFSGLMDELTVYARALSDPEIAAIAAGGANGKADAGVPADRGLAELDVSVDGASLGVVYGENAQWTTATAEFTALETNAVLQLQSLQPGTLVGGVTLSEVPSELYYLPEVPLSDLYGQDAYGVWTLEIWDDRAGPATTNAQLMAWQLNFGLAPSNPPPVITLSHGIAYTNSLPAYGVQYFRVPVPQWATRATNLLEFAVQAQTTSPLPVTVLFNPTNYPSATDGALMGPLVANGTVVLTTNTTPPLVIGQTYYLALTNPNPVAVTFGLGVWFDLTTLANCQMTSTVVSLAGIPRYFQFDVPATAPQQVTLWLSGANSNLTVVLSEHLPLPDLDHYDYLSQQPCTNDEIVMVLTNSTPFAIQTNRWYAGVFNTTATNVPFTIQACVNPAYPAIIPLTDGVSLVVPLPGSPLAAPPGPPQQWFFDFSITNRVSGVLFELYNLSGDADLVLQRDALPAMAPYFAGSFAEGPTPEQIVLRTNAVLPDLRGHWYLGVYNNETVRVAYTLRAALPNTNGLLVSAQTLQLVQTPLNPPGGLLLSWNSVAGESYLVNSATSLVGPVNWTTLGSVVATTPWTTFAVPVVPGGSAYYQIVQVASLQPQLTIQLWPTNRIRLSWSTDFPGYTLQAKHGLFGSWTNAGLPVTVVGNQFVAFDAIGPVPIFYRLVK